MANGNIFLTKTDSKILPLISQFTNYLYRYIDAQGQLADKIYAYDKQKQGEKFIQDYGVKLRGTTTPEELNTIMGEATQYAGSKGLTQHLSVLGTLAQSQGNLISMEQNKEKAGLFINTLKSNYGDMTAPWKGNPNVKISSIVDDINATVKDPTTKLSMLEQVAKSMNKTDYGLTWDEQGNFKVVEGTADVTGRQIASKEPVAVGTTPEGRKFLDVDQSGKQEEGEGFVTPDLATKISQVEQGLRDKKDQGAVTYNKLDRKTVYDPKTNQWTQVLEDYRGRWFTIDEKGEKGDLIPGSGLMEGVDYRSIKKASSSGISQARKEKNTEVVNINNIIAADETLAKVYHKKQPGVNTSISGTNYMTEVALNNKMQAIDFKLRKMVGETKEAGEKTYNLERQIRDAMNKEESGKKLTESEKKLLDDVNDLGLGEKTEMRLIQKGAYKQWRENYWNARKQYERTYQQYFNQYEESPDFFTPESPKEPYLSEIEQPQESNEAQIVANPNGGGYYVTIPGENPKFVLFKTQADSLVEMHKKEKNK